MFGSLFLSILYANPNRLIHDESISCVYCGIFSMSHIRYITGRCRSIILCVDFLQERGMLLSSPDLFDLEEPGTLRKIDPTQKKLNLEAISQDFARKIW